MGRWSFRGGNFGRYFDRSEIRPFKKLNDPVLKRLIQDNIGREPTL